MKVFKIYIIVMVFITLQFGCKNKVNTFDLLTGDIFFCGYQAGDLSNAIDKVTQTARQTHYSHMGLIEINDTDTFVIHASLKRGVVKESLQSFLTIDNPAFIDIYRFTDKVSINFSPAINSANKLVGLPYNSHYVMNDSCYYCSQLIYKIFEYKQLFKLEPMTFKNPNSDDFNDGWVKHYQALDMDIPEGKLGCNPNGMAASENLKFVKRL